MKMKRLISVVTALVITAGTTGIIASTPNNFFAGNTAGVSAETVASSEPMGFAKAAGVTLQSMDETSSTYAKVSNAQELEAALKKKSGIKTIEITQDIDLGYNVITADGSTFTRIVENNTPVSHPTLKETGVSKVYIQDFTDGLTIYSKNGAKILHAGFNIKKCKNVVIQNIQFDELWEWDENTKGNYDRNDWDYMTIENCNGVWVDHCTFGKAYDGVIDSKKGTNGLTISWCKFLDGDSSPEFFKAQFDELEANKSSNAMYKYLRDDIGLSQEQIMQVASPQKKTHLIGATELSADNNELEATLCYNYYENSQDRMPRLRGGNVHAFNNIMDASGCYEAAKLISSDASTQISSKGYHFGITSNGAISTENGAVLLENCVIKGIKRPLGNNQKDASKTNYTGKIVANNCYYEYGDTKFTGNSTDADSPLAPTPADDVAFSWNSTANLTVGKVPYVYSLYSLDEVETAVKAGAGVNASTPIEPTDTTTTTVTTAETEPTTTTTVTQQTTVTTVPTQPTETTTVTSPTITADTIFCSPDGSDTADGTQANPMSFRKALESVKAGGAIYMLGGTYSFDSVVTIAETNNGEEGKFKTIKPYGNEKVVLDFSAESYNMDDVSVNDRGIQLNGSYWYIYGIKITGAADNGMYVTGNHNRIELCEFEGNRDTGLQISRRNSSLSDIADWPSYNLILNCTSCNNMDPATGENADGFAAKLTCGVGNVFDGCIAYNNVDDGWDLYAKSATGPIGVVTIRNCISFRNGQTAEGVFTKNSDGNGFKMGGGGVGTAHIVENCLSFENKKHGFTDNNNPAFSTLKNCTSFSNGMDSGANFQMDRCTAGTFENCISYKNNSGTSDKFNGTGTNLVFFNSKKYYQVEGTLALANSKAGTQITGPTDDDFVSVEVPALGADVHTLWRNADGSINTHGFMQLKDSSKFASLGADFDNTTPVVPPTPTETTTTTATTEPTDTEPTTTTTTPTNTEPTTTTTTPTDTTTSSENTKTLLGDANLDGKVNIVDLMAIARHVSALDTLTGQAFKNADYSQDGKVNIMDLYQVAQKVAGLI